MCPKPVPRPLKHPQWSHWPPPMPPAPGLPPPPDIRDHLFLVQGPGLLAWASTVGEHTQERQDSGELAAMGRDRGQGQQKISSPSVGTSDAGPSPD